MESLHSPTSSSRSNSGRPEEEHSQVLNREHNQTTSTAATDAGRPASVVLQNPQSAAADSGRPESAVLHPQIQPMEGVTEQSVPPDMSKLQDEQPRYSTDSGADSAESETDSSVQPWKYPSTDVREKRKRERRLARKALRAKATDSDTAAGANVPSSNPPPPTKPLYKADVPKNRRPYIWNSSNKKSLVPRDITPPKKMSVDGIDIYLQILTSAEAKICGISGWDTVLTDIERYCPEVADRKIARFWASWRHDRVMAKRFKNKSSNPAAVAAGSSTSNPAAVAAGPSTSIDTPQGDDASKRKRTGTPGSTEPPSKKSLTSGESYSQVAGAAPPPPTPPPHQTLWVHSNDAEKGPIEKDMFFEIVSQCNIIKNLGAIEGDPEFCWKSNLLRQPYYDTENSRGKIVCGDQKTHDFWVKFIPIAAITVGNLNCKAWTWKEYEVPKIRYSFLIPFDTCNGIDAKPLVQGTLAVNQLSMVDVLSCRTSYSKTNKQRICNIEVTDKLARAIDDAERVLVGPVCPLHFKLQSEDTGDLCPDSACPEIESIQPDEVEQLLGRESIEDDAYVGNFGVSFDQLLDGSVDPPHPSHPGTGSSTCTVISSKTVKSGKTVVSLNTAVENLTVTPGDGPKSPSTPTTPTPPFLPPP